MINLLKISNNPKAKEYLKRFFGIEEKPKYDFKPFDKVLVKYYEDDNWEGNLFIRTITDDQDGETKYECLNGVVFDIDGRGNTERLVARNPKLRNLLEDGEYIPSLGQLNLMAHYMNELNKAFAYVSASPLSSTWYWSSTESSQAVAWYVVFSSGLTGTGNKHIGDMVRAVIDF